MNVIESIYKEPLKWMPTEYTLKHENGAEIWTGGTPILDTNMHPETPMGLIMKVRLWWAMRWWSKNAPVEAFGVGRRN